MTTNNTPAIPPLENDITNIITVFPASPIFPLKDPHIQRLPTLIQHAYEQREHTTNIGQRVRDFINFINDITPPEELIRQVIPRVS